MSGTIENKPSSAPQKSIQINIDLAKNESNTISNKPIANTIVVDTPLNSPKSPSNHIAEMCGHDSIILTPVYANGGF